MAGSELLAFQSQFASKNCAAKLENDIFFPMKTQQ
jgi:hypothetical protein